MGLLGFKHKWAGKQAPDFELPDQSGNLIRLNDLVSKGPVIIFFYPKDFTAGCTAEVCSFRDRYQEFIDEGASIIGISRDDELSHKAFSDKHHLQYPILSDIDSKVHRAYKVDSILGIIKSRETFLIGNGNIVLHHFTSNIQFDLHAKTMLAEVAKLN